MLIFQKFFFHFKASINGNSNIVQSLVDAHASPNLKDNSGSSALFQGKNSVKMFLIFFVMRFLALSNCKRSFENC